MLLKMKVTLRISRVSRKLLVQDWNTQGAGYILLYGIFVVQKSTNMWFFPCCVVYVSKNEASDWSRG